MLNTKTFIKLSRTFSKSLISRRPSLIQCALYLSFRCNLKCHYCNFPNLEVNELELHQWYQIIDELADLNCCRVTLIGGEPLIYPHLAEIIHRIRSKGMACVVCSNGILIPDYIETLAEADTLVLSLDAAGPEHDRIRGPGAWKSVKEALRVSSQRDLDVKVNSVLTSETLFSLENLLTFAKEHRIGITVNVVRTGNRNLWKNAFEYTPKNSEIRKTFHSLSTYSRQNRFLLFSPEVFNIAGSWPDYSIDCIQQNDMKHFINQWEGPDCQAGRFYMSILPNGSAVPCPIHIDSEEAKNVLEGGVEKAWMALHSHSCAACYTPCLLALNLLFSFNRKALFNFFTRHAPRVT